MYILSDKVELYSVFGVKIRVYLRGSISPEGTKNVHFE